MTRQKLRHLMIGLLMLTGVFHFAVALFGDADGIRLPLAAFGFIYSGLGFYLRKDVGGAKPLPIMVAIAVTSLGLLLGGANYLANGGPIALPIMFAVDVVIIGTGVLWLLKGSQKKS